jgi:hypothetical protein
MRYCTTPKKKFMKNRNLWKLALGVGVSALPLAGGCLQDSTQPVVQSGSMTPAAQFVSYQTAVPDAEPPDAPPLETLTEAPVEPISTNTPVPSKIHLTTSAAELVKLANSGVDEGVMLAYVTNSSSTFNLSAEEIIYLNDIGVPSPVVTAMIQRDQALKGSATSTLAATAPPPVQTAPAPVPAPTPGDVAPQGYNQPPPYPTEPPPPVEQDVSYPEFYDSLAPYGTWVNVDGYGACWRPTAVVVNPGWQPYFDCGHWAYTDCGWYWMSDYSWGWAPFHYGRWFHHSHWGWCWAPGTVWGPSWVAFRYSNDYCGWAPLPPGAYFSFSFGLTFHGHPVHNWDDCGLHASHYRFVAWHNFDNHHLHAYALPPRQVNQIYNNTRVVNNITVVNNNTVINNGVPLTHITAATHRDIKPIAIRETSAAGSISGHAERLSGNTLTVYKPAISPPLAGNPMGNRKPIGVGPGGSPNNLSKPMPAPGNRTRSGNSNLNAPRSEAKPAPVYQGQATANVRGPGGSQNASIAGSVTALNNESGYVSSQAKPLTATVQKPNVATTAHPNSPPTWSGSTGQNARYGLAVNRPYQPAPYKSPDPAWLNADPNARFDHNQPSVRTTPNSQQYNVPSYPQARTTQEVPRYAPAPGYSQQRNYSPPPAAYYRSDPGQSRPNQSYSSPAYSAPSYSAPAARAPSAQPAPAPAPSNSRNDYSNNNNGGRK